MTRPPAECGTLAARSRHQRLGEPMDEACRIAHAAHMRQYRYARQRGTEYRVSAVGVARRIQALMRLGYSLEVLGKELGVVFSNVCRLYAYAETITPETHRKVRDLFERLEMTPGPSRMAAEYAKRKGWPPPLAWDPETIDNPETLPAGVRNAAPKPPAPPKTPAANSKPDWHGTPGGYGNHKCRCWPCCSAHRSKMAELRRRRLSQRVKVGERLVHPTAKHGLATTYSNYGCRCVPCADAWRGYHKDRRERRKAA